MRVGKRELIHCQGNKYLMLTIGKQTVGWAYTQMLTLHSETEDRMICLSLSRNDEASLPEKLTSSTIWHDYKGARAQASEE